MSSSSQSTLQILEGSYSTNWSSDSLASSLESGQSYQATVTNKTQSQMTVQLNDSNSSLLQLNLDSTDTFEVGDSFQLEILESSKQSMQVAIQKSNTQEEELSQADGTSSSDDEDQDMSVTEKIAAVNKIRAALVASGSSLQYASNLNSLIYSSIQKIESLMSNFSGGEVASMVSKNMDVDKMSLDLLNQVAYSPQFEKQVSLTQGENGSQVSISVDDEKVKSLIEQEGNKSVLATTSSDRIKEVMQSLSANDVEPTLQNIEKVVSNQNKVDQIQDMDTESMVQFLSSDKEATISELYKSTYSRSSATRENQVSEDDYQAIDDQVKALVDERFQDAFDSGVSSEEIYDISKELVKKGVALDDRTMDVLEFVKASSSQSDMDQTIIRQMKQGESFDNFVVSQSGSSAKTLTSEEVKDVLKTLDESTAETVQNVLNNNQTVNATNLKRSIQEMSNNQEESSATSQAVQTSQTVQVTTMSKDVEDLEVLRYQMTFKAAMQLSIQGVDLRTEQLGSLRDRLENFQNQMYFSQEQENISNDLESTVSNAQKVNTSASQVWQSLSTHIARINAGTTQTIASLASEGQDTTTLSYLSNQASYGAERYDSLRTMPCSDLGDTVESAFGNVNDILEDMGLMTTDYNQRAVQILGRNGMAITQENIESVKTLDIQVQEVVDQLMPTHVQQMVQSGTDIINTPLDEVLSTIQSINQDLEQDANDSLEERLLALNKDSSVSDSTKESVLGVYRLLHTVESSKGAAAGLLVQNNLPVTLENLFDAAKYLGKTGTSTTSTFERTVDDENGAIESLDMSTMSIKDQIKSGYYETSQAIDNLIQDTYEGSDSLSGEVSEDVLEAMATIDDSLDKEHQSTLHDLLNQAKDASTQTWEASLKLDGDLSLKTMSDFQDWQSDSFLAKESLQDVTENQTETLSMDNESLSDAVSAYKENPTIENRQRVYDSLDEALTKVQETSIDQELSALESGSDLEDDSNSQDTSENNKESIKEVKNQLGLQEKMMSAMDQDYQTVPIWMNGQWQQMNMYYLPQEETSTTSESTSSLYFSFSTKTLGTINIKATMSEDQLQVSAYATEEEGNSYIQAHSQELKEAFSSAGLSLGTIDYEDFDVPRPLTETSAKTSIEATMKKMQRYNNSLFETVI